MYYEYIDLFINVTLIHKDVCAKLIVNSLSNYKTLSIKYERINKEL